MNSTYIEKSAKRIPWLAGIFIAQLALAVVLFNSGREGPKALNEPLLVFDTATVDKVELAGDKETLVLQKKDGQWQLGEGLPVPTDRVQGLLQQIAELRRGWPVGNTPEASKRFQVNEESFVRKIRLLQGDSEMALIYLGNAPSFRSAHLRLAGEADIYALKLDEYSVPTLRDGWLDPDLLRPKGEVLALQLGDHKVSKTDGQWPAVVPVEAEEGKGEPTQPFDSAAFASALADLMVLGVAEKQAEFDAPITTDPANQEGNSLLRLVWTVTTSEGTYEYHLLGKEDQYYIRRNDNHNTFRLSKVQYDALVKIQELRASANS